MKTTIWRWLLLLNYITQLVPYQVLLSYPDPQKLNTLKVLDNQSAVVFEANNFEDMSLPFVTNQTNYPYYLRSIFNAYSASGDVTVMILCFVNLKKSIKLK